MKISVQLFAILRDRLGTQSLELEIPDGTTAQGALDALAKRDPSLRPLLAATRVAVNEEYADADRVLAPTDDVAFIPPVSGG